MGRPVPERLLVTIDDPALAIGGQAFGGNRRALTATLAPMRSSSLRNDPHVLVLHFEAHDEHVWASGIAVKAAEIR